MKIDDILAAAKNNFANAPEELGKFVDDLVDAEDFKPGERSAFCGGYMAGMAHALTIVTENGDPDDIVAEIMAKEVTWDMKDWT